MTGTPPLSPDAVLARFGAYALMAYQEHDREGLDGDELQEWGVAAGVFVESRLVVPCGDGERCICAEYWDRGETATCYRIPLAVHERARALEAARGPDTPMVVPGFHVPANIGTGEVGSERGDESGG